ncbi:hypothetical protein [Aquimarina macrocephali]|uniref:hypothetical protein n=1 Tax=Aquimarina macrocephali TaxID=666563 RepID=UPI003F676CCF
MENIREKGLYNVINYFLNKKWISRIVIRFLSEEKKERILIESMRDQLAFFGNDTTNITDEEIKEGIKRIPKAIGSFGATLEEAATASRVLSSLKV